MSVVAFVGVSGVGKSTFLKNAATTIPFLHLEAGKLIREEFEMTEGVVPMKLDKVLVNQELLVKAFRRNISGYDGLAVINGHTVLDTESGPQKVPASIFSQMNVGKIILLQDDPKAITRRRKADASRSRPVRTIEEIADHQQLAITTAADIARTLGIPLHIVTHETATVACQLLRS